MRRVVPGLVLPLVLLTAACGGSDTTSTTARVGTLADVTVSGPVDAKPTVDFKAPLSFASTTSEVVNKGPGRGAAVRADSVVTIDYVAIDASDASEYDSSWSRGQPATFALGQVIQGLGEGLAGDHAGDRVLVGIASQDGYDPVGNGTTIHKGDSIIMVVDIRSVANPLTHPVGAKLSAPATVPTLEYDAKGQPTGFKATASSPKSVDKLGVYPIVKGSGPVIKSGQTLVVDYLGQIYPDGTVFDQTYGAGQPVPVSIGTGQVIPGWDKGLVGQPVGSRVVLVIPSADGYGSTGQGGAIPPDSDLIFVVDILQAY